MSAIEVPQEQDHDDAPVTVTGTVDIAPELRYAPQSDAPVARFRISSCWFWSPRERRWTKGLKKSYVCTVWHTAAEHTVESLTLGVRVVVFGHITDAEGVNDTHITVADVGVSLHHRIVYTEASLPSPRAAASQTLPPAHPAEQPERTTPRPPGAPPQGWHELRRAGWSGFAQVAAHATSDPATFHIT